MEEASPVLLIPWGWRAIAPSRWLHEVLSLTLGWCCHPILGGSLGASPAAAPLPLGAGSFCIVKQPWSSSLLGSSGLPHPSHLWGAPWALEEGAWWGPGWDMAGEEATGCPHFKVTEFYLGLCLQRCGVLISGDEVL